MILQVTRKIIEPYAECRSNHEVICALGKRLGADHPAFSMTAWELMDETLKASGLPGAEEAHKARWIEFSKAPEELNFLNGFKHADGRFHFAPDWAALGPAHAGMPALPDHMDNIEAADAKHPYRLVTAPARRFLNSTFTETRRSQKKEGRPTALIHPDDCADLGLEDGGRVRIGNERADVVVHVRAVIGVD